MKLTKPQQAIVDALQANPLAWIKDYGAKYCVFPHDGTPLTINDKTLATLKAGGVLTQRELTPEQIALWPAGTGRPPTRGLMLAKYPASANRQLAEAIADRLFTGGFGKAQRLVLEMPNMQDGGGWSEACAADQIEKLLIERTTTPQ